jgi:nickel-dependent lactate racemase
MLFFENGSTNANLSSDDLRQGVLAGLTALGPVRNMLLIPPDITRLHSRAGELTQYIYGNDPSAVKAIMPALGTHRPMNTSELRTMFGEIPQHLFVEHRWRSDCEHVGVIPGDQMHDLSGGVINYEMPVSFNKRLLAKEFDCILSISQVVPHEVAGMAGYTKNLFVGCGGSENIHKSHFLGAAYGMERIMGKADTPVRRVFNHACQKFLRHQRIVHIITVIGMDNAGQLVTRGLFIGDDDDCYHRATQLSRQVNVHLLDEPIKKAVVYLDPVEYKSTWLGNKSIYRTRMAIADGGELVVLAPGVNTFGEDKEIDGLIRKFGYKGTPATLQSVSDDECLCNNLSAAAHLIHGSSEGRFSITYCAGGLCRSEIESTGFKYTEVSALMQRYDPRTLAEGRNVMPDGEEIYYISQPGTGLWAWKEKF